MHPLMGSSRLLAMVDGQKAWEEMCGEIRRTLDDPLRGLPVLGVFVLVMLVMWMNVRIVRWLLSTPDVAHHNTPHTHEADRPR